MNKGLIENLSPDYLQSFSVPCIVLIYRRHLLASIRSFSVLLFICHVLKVVLSLDHLQGAFLSLFLGSAAGVLVLFVEYFTARFLHTRLAYKTSRSSNSSSNSNLLEKERFKHIRRIQTREATQTTEAAMGKIPSRHQLRNFTNTPSVFSNNYTPSN